MVVTGANRITRISLCNARSTECTAGLGGVAIAATYDCFVWFYDTVDVIYTQPRLIYYHRNVSDISVPITQARRDM